MLTFEGRGIEREEGEIWELRRRGFEGYREVAIELDKRE